MRHAGATAWLFLALAGCWPSLEQPPSEPPVQPTDEALLARRPYELKVPPSYSPTTPLPLLVVLGGYGSGGEQAAAYLGFTSLAQREGFLLAMPDGLYDSRGNRAWHPGADHSTSWDVEYLLALVHDVEARYAVDRHRVFFAGHSQGAHMAHRMACDGAMDVAAILSVAGQVSKVPAECAPRRGVSVLQVHGDQDAVIGYLGDVQHDPPWPSVPSAAETVGVWGRLDGCQQDLVDTGQRLDLAKELAGAETDVAAFPGCGEGRAVELWTIEGGGHTPGWTSTFASSAWRFLHDHPAPR